MFGMGTGGSLRLLSPETRGASAFCCRLSGSVGSAKQRPPDFPSSASHQVFPHPQNRTGSSSVCRLTKASYFALLETLSAFSQTTGSGILRFKVSLDQLRSRSLARSSCSLFPSFQDQALDRLVSSSSIRYRTFTDDLSTLSSSRGLTCFKQWQFYSPGGLHA